MLINIKFLYILLLSNLFLPKIDMADTIWQNKYERREFTSTSAVGYAQDVAATDLLVLPASQSIPDITNTAVDLPTGVLASGNGNVDGNGVIFIAVRGVYHVEASVSWNAAGGATNGNRGSYWEVRNDATKKMGFTKTSAAGAGLGFNQIVTHSAFTMLLEVGDSVELWCYHSNGAPIDILGSDTGGADHTTVTINKV